VNYEFIAENFWGNCDVLWVCGVPNQRVGRNKEENFI
jgi:hypothetical protein